MKTRVVVPPEGIAEAADLLAAGELAALPTETVYGLGAHALDPVACAKIFEAKDRPLYDPLIVHLPDLGWLDRLARPLPLARTLAEKFWPGPLTLVLPRTDLVPDIVTSGQDTVALRLSAHPIFRRVAEAFGRPIAAPSANRFGRISPTTAGHVLAELDGRIPLILDGGPCEHGVESTILYVREHTVEILRHGPITSEQLREFSEVRDSASNPTVPGAMKSHYAPRTQLTVLTVEQVYVPGPAARAGLITWKGFDPGIEEKYTLVERLSSTQDFREAAANLYGAMRRLDEAGLQVIIVQPVPLEGLGVAIMDRLNKAAARD